MKHIKSFEIKNSLKFIFMRKNILALVTLFAAFTFIACDDEGSGEVYMKIEEVHFTPRGGEADIRMTVDGSYKVETKESWLECWGGDRSLIVKADPFFSGVKRTGIITVTTKTTTRKISVTQFPDEFEIKNDGTLFTSLIKEKEYKISVKNSFNGDLSRIKLRLKDKADADWVDASFLNESEIAIKTKSNPLMKSQETMIYVDVEGDIETTTMDSLLVKSIILKQDLIDSKWKASFINENKAKFNYDVELSLVGNYGYLQLKGVPISENSKDLTEITLNFEELKGDISFVLNKYNTEPILTEDEDVENYVVSIKEDKTWWEVGDYSGPSAYEGKIDTESEKGSIVLDFSGFTHSHWSQGETKVIGFMFRSYKPKGWYDLEPVETRRQLFDFKLTMVK